MDLHTQLLHLTQTSCRLLYRWRSLRRQKPLNNIYNKCPSLIYNAKTRSKRNVCENTKRCFPVDGFRRGTIPRNRLNCVGNIAACRIANHTKPPTSSRNGQFSVSSFSSNSFCLTPTLSGTLCTKVTRNLFIKYSAKLCWDIVRVPLCDPSSSGILHTTPIHLGS